MCGWYRLSHCSRSSGRTAHLVMNSIAGPAPAARSFVSSARASSESGSMESTTGLAERKRMRIGRSDFTACSSIFRLGPASGEGGGKLRSDCLPCLAQPSDQATKRRLLWLEGDRDADRLQSSPGPVSHSRMLQLGGRRHDLRGELAFHPGKQNVQPSKEVPGIPPVRNRVTPQELRELIKKERLAFSADVQSVWSDIEDRTDLESNGQLALPEAEPLTHRNPEVRLQAKAQIEVQPVLPKRLDLTQPRATLTE